MTHEQKQRVASLQIAFLALQAKMCQGKAVNERDDAIRASMIRLVAEPDKEVQEAFLRWRPATWIWRLHSPHLMRPGAKAPPRLEMRLRRLWLPATEPLQSSSMR